MHAELDVMGWPRRLAKKLGSYFSLPIIELPREREKELIEKIAQEVTKRGIEIPVLFGSWILLPTSPIYGSLFLTPMAPVLDGLGLKGSYVDEIAAFIRKRENLSALIERIEQLKEEKETQKKIV